MLVGEPAHNFQWMHESKRLASSLYETGIIALLMNYRFCIKQPGIL